MLPSSQKLGRSLYFYKKVKKWANYFSGYVLYFVSFEGICVSLILQLIPFTKLAFYNAVFKTSFWFFPQYMFLIRDSRKILKRVSNTELYIGHNMTAKDWSCPMYGFNVPYGDLELVTGMEKFQKSFYFFRATERHFLTLPPPPLHSWFYLKMLLTTFNLVSFSKFLHGKQGSPRGRTVACCVFKIQAVWSGTGG